jgi:hypothetical protein
LPTFTTIPGSNAELTGTVFAAIVNELRPTFLRKATPQNLTSNSAVLQNDADLVAAVAASTTYEFEAFLFYQSSVTADFKTAWTWPAGSVLYYAASGLDTSLALQQVTSLADVSGSTRSWGGAGVSAARWVSFNGHLITGGSAGNFQLQYAQNTATIETDQALAGSWLRIWQVL